MELTEEQLLAARIIPPVAELTLRSSADFTLRDGASFTVRGAENDEVARIVRRYWNITPAVKTLPPDSQLAPESYEIEVCATGVEINAADVNGVRYALRTLRQLSEAEHGVLKSTFSALPQVHTKDAPQLRFRGVHLCWFPETPAWEIEKQIRLAAYYKFNYVVLESWGVLKLDSFPEFVWEEFAVDKTEIARLVQLCKELGITLIPQLNIFGHATAARCTTGKHTLLDFHPEFAPLFEPDGWTWCLSNPHTRNILSDITNEICDLFESPPYFHIGCDEAYNADSCSVCRRSDYTALLKDHLLYFHDLLARRGARTMMWHDMLIAREDERWEGYTAYGKKDGGLDQLYRNLPKDIVICDWQYGYPEKDGKAPDWSTLQFFHDAGFEVVACPWLDAQGTRSLGEFAVNNHLPGLLATTWHRNRGRHLYKIFLEGAQATWGNHQPPNSDVVIREFMNYHLRQIGHDMGITQYVQTGSAPYQIDTREFPA